MGDAFTAETVKDLIHEEISSQFKDLQDEMKARQSEWAQKMLTQPAPTKDKGVGAGRFIRVMAAAKGDPERAAKIATHWGDEVMAKALSESVFASGGALIPEVYAAEIIDLLAARAVVRGMGVQPVPMDTGTLTMPYMASGSSAGYIGENTNIAKSEQTFGQLKLFAKKLAALVPISNDLLRSASPQADAIVRNDVVRQMSLREDLAFIRDDGSEDKPKGMRYWADAGNVFARTQDTGANTLATVTTDLHKAVRVLEEANVPLLTPGWLFTPRTKHFLMSLRDGNGNYVFNEEMGQGTLLGFNYRTTTQIPNNLNTDESEVFFADFSSLVIGESTRLELEAFDGGAYFDGSAVVSGISQDATVVRAIARHDFGSRYRGKDIAVITTVDWI